MKGDDFLKELHTDDLSMNSGKLFREQMIENFKAIEQEVQDREGEDNDLQGQINTLRTKLSTAEGNITDLQKRTVSLEEQVAKLNRIIFGTEYINDTDEIPLDDSMTPGKDEEINDTKVVSDDYSEVEKPDHEVIADEIN